MPDSLYAFLGVFVALLVIAECSASLWEYFWEFLR